MWSIYGDFFSCCSNPPTSSSYLVEPTCYALSSELSFVPHSVLHLSLIREDLHWCPLIRGRGHSGVGVCNIATYIILLFLIYIYATPLHTIQQIKCWSCQEYEKRNDESRTKNLVWNFTEKTWWLQSPPSKNDLILHIRLLLFQTDACDRNWWWLTCLTRSRKVRSREDSFFERFVN